MRNEYDNRMDDAGGAVEAAPWKPRRGSRAVEADETLIGREHGKPVKHA